MNNYLKGENNENTYHKNYCEDYVRSCISKSLAEGSVPRELKVLSLITLFLLSLLSWLLLL